MPRFDLIQTVSDYYLARALTNDGEKPLNVREFIFMADRLDELRREGAPHRGPIVGHLDEWTGDEAPPST